jgi:hypothetical protein
MYCGDVHVEKKFKFFWYFKIQFFLVEKEYAPWEKRFELNFLEGMAYYVPLTLNLLCVNLRGNKLSIHLFRYNFFRPCNARVFFLVLNLHYLKRKNKFLILPTSQYVKLLVVVHSVRFVIPRGPNWAKAQLTRAEGERQPKPETLANPRARGDRLNLHIPSHLLPLPRRRGYGESMSLPWPHYTAAAQGNPSRIELALTRLPPTHSASTAATSRSASGG